MTQIFTPEGKVIPVTVVEAGPCTVTQIKTVEKEGYNAVQLGFGPVREKKLNRPQRGHFESKELQPLRHLAEIRVEDPASYQIGQEISVDSFTKGDRVDITGRSRGKGFAGVHKRHHFKGGPGTHGSNFHRAPGSIGQSADPSKVVKGKRLPGHMGNERNTAKNLEVVKVDAEKNLLIILGAVPGANGGYVEVKKRVKGSK